MGKMIYAVCAVCMMCLASFGQTAKVIALSKEDAARAKQIHEDMDRAEKALHDLEIEIRIRYLQANSGVLVENRIGEVLQYKDGWSRDFEYSDDWLYIVPKRIEWPNASTGVLSIGGTTWCPGMIVPSAVNPAGLLYSAPMSTQ